MGPNCHSSSLTRRTTGRYHLHSFDAQRKVTHDATAGLEQALSASLSPLLAGTRPLSEGCPTDPSIHMESRNHVSGRETQGCVSHSFQGWIHSGPKHDSEFHPIPPPPES